MSTADAVRGHAVVVQPGEAASYWQPVPANGHADPTLTPAATNRRSLNLEVIAVLESATRATPVDVGALLARARAVRLRLKRPVSDEYIHRAKRRGRL